MDFGGDSTPFFSLFWHGGSPQNSYQTKMSGMVLGRASQIVFFQFGMRFPFKIHARLEGPGAGFPLKILRTQVAPQVRSSLSDLDVTSI